MISISQMHVIGSLCRWREGACAWAHASVVLVAAAMSLAGCAGAPQPTLDASKVRTSVQLSARLLDASDTASAAFDRIVNRALMDGADTRTLASFMLTRADASGNIRTLALGADPAGALVDLYVHSNLALWACENRVRAHPELPLMPCPETFGVLQADIAEIAREYMSPEKLATVDRAIDAWKQSHPRQLVIGLIRLSDLADSSGTAPVVLEQVAPSMFSPVSEAAQQLQEARLLGYQALWLASRLPTSVSWQLDATLYVALASEPANKALTNVESLSSGISDAHQVFGKLAQSNLTLSERATALSERIDALEKSVVALSDGLGSNLTGVSTSLGSLSSEVRELDGADQLATRIVRQATWSGVALISLAAGSLALVLWSHRHHARRAASTSKC